MPDAAEDAVVDPHSHCTVRNHVRELSHRFGLERSHKTCAQRKLIVSSKNDS